MADPPSIQPVTAGDVPALLALIKELADYERLAHLVIATEADLRDALFGERPVIEAVTASLDGHPVGYALWFQTFSTFLGRRGIYLEDLYVRPDWRGRGVGRALLTHLARVAVARDCGRIEWAVLDWNEPALEFYRGIGARPIGDWTIFRLTGEPLAELGKG